MEKTQPVVQATEYDELYVNTSLHHARIMNLRKRTFEQKGREKFAKRSKPVHNGLSDFFPNTVVKLDNVGCPKFSSFSLSLSVPTP